MHILLYTHLSKNRNSYPERYLNNYLCNSKHKYLRSKDETQMDYPQKLHLSKFHDRSFHSTSYMSKNKYYCIVQHKHYYTVNRNFHTI